MKNLLVIFILQLFVLLPVQAQQPFTTAQNGPWQAPETWNNTEVPGSSDIVVISHEVTIGTNATIGHSPGVDDELAAIEVTAGSLTLSEGVTLICRGDIRLHPGNLILNPGAILEMDTSQAATPMTSVYKIDIRPDDGSNNALLIVKGTAQARCQIRANESGAHTRITDGNDRSNGGRMIADFCDFIRLGGNPDYQAWQYNPTSSGDIFRIRDCTFDRCSRTSARYDIPAGGHVEYIRCIFTNSISNPGGNDYWEIYSGGAEYGATMRLIQCAFDHRVYLGKPRDYEIEDCVFKEGIKSYSGNWRQGIYKSFKRNFIRWLQEGSEWSVTFGNTIEDSIFIKDIPGGWNPHFISIDGETGPLNIRNNIFWFTGVADHSEGDTWMMGSASEGTRQDNTVTFEKNIYLPNGQGPEGYNTISGTGFTILVRSDIPKQVIFKRNTVFAGGGAGGCNLGETQEAYTGDVANFKSNLLIGANRSGDFVGEKLHNLGHAEIDVVRGIDADYNAGFHLSDGDCHTRFPGSGKGYHRLDFSDPTSQIGQHDIDDVDPRFIDDLRTPATWDHYLGGSGSLNGTMDRLTIGGGASILDLLHYLREGFRPQNPVLKSAGDPQDGSPDIGAVDMIQSTPIRAPTNLHIQ